MKLVSITCPHCGAKLQATPNAKMLTCDYCNGDFMIDDEVKLISPAVIEPIQDLKVQYLGGHNPRLHTDEVLIALSVCELFLLQTSR